MSDRNCAYHESHPAIAICSACREDICVQCHRVTMTGYALCTTCERKFLSAFETEWEAARGPVQYLAGYSASAFRVLTSARLFFARQQPGGGWVRPAIFGLISYGIGIYAQIVWSWMFVPDFVERITASSGSAELSQGAVAAMLFAAVPFAAPLIFAIHILLLGVSLRLFGAQVQFRTVVRIAGYAGAAHLLQLVPPIADVPVGYIMSIVWLVNIELIAVRRFYESIGFWRGMAAVFLPFAVLSLMPV